jgi:hypothetical protein
MGGPETLPNLNTLVAKKPRLTDPQLSQRYCPELLSGPTLPPLLDSFPQVVTLAPLLEASVSTAQWAPSLELHLLALALLVVDIPATAAAAAFDAPVAATLGFAVVEGSRAHLRCGP